jgi:hypothetical protein
VPIRKNLHFMIARLADKSRPFSRFDGIFTNERAPLTARCTVYQLVSSDVFSADLGGAFWA